MAIEGIRWGLPSILFFDVLNDRGDYIVLFIVALLLLLPMFWQTKSPRQPNEVPQ